jgi:hypothetical protein
MASGCAINSDINLMLTVAICLHYREKICNATHSLTISQNMPIMYVAYLTLDTKLRNTVYNYIRVSIPLRCVRAHTCSCKVAVILIRF